MPTDERPYHCDVCNMTFRYQKALKLHMFRHKKDYPYSCSCVVKVLVVMKVYIRERALTSVMCLITPLLRRVL